MDEYTRTEFPRWEPDAGGGSVSTLLARLLQFGGGDSTPAGEPAPAGDSAPAGDLDEPRGLQQVLRRISSLVPLGASGATSALPARYADTELARYWMPDDVSRECVECEARFSALRRRHHCRVCGQVFCSRCCSQRVPGELLGCTGGLRVCTHCAHLVLRCVRERDDIPDLRSLHQELKVEMAGEQFSPAGRGLEEEVVTRAAHDDSIAAHPERPALLLQQAMRALPLQQHRYRLRRYSGVWRGADLVAWLADGRTAGAVRAACAALVDAGALICVTEHAGFVDDALYRPAAPPDDALRRSITPPLDDALPSRVDGSPSREHEGGSGGVETERAQYCLDLDLDAARATLRRARPAPADAAQTRLESETDASIVRAGREHVRLLAGQALARAGLSAAWADTLLPLCAEAAAHLRLPHNTTDQHPARYVQFKKVVGGLAADSRLVSGVVVRKRCAHRDMPTRVSDANVLLLDCAVPAARRDDARLASLEPLALREREYLARTAARVLAWRPSVVVARGPVAHGVREALRGAGVALVTHVRASALARLARCLRADALTSVDAIGAPRLGRCRLFHVDTSTGGPLMTLEGCAAAELGCCVLLCGGSRAELVRVKRVARSLLLACYNWRLERALLGDMRVELPRDMRPPPDQHATHSEAATPPPTSTCGEVARGDKTPACGVAVRDDSDPLRAAFDEPPPPTPPPTSRAHAEPQRRWWAEEVVLSMSPHVVVAAPALETEAMRRCPLRQFYRLPHYRTEPPAPLRPPDLPAPPPLTPPPQPAHTFVRRPLAAPAERAAVRADLASYRATGGNPVVPHTPRCAVWARASTVRSKRERESEPDLSHEPLAPENHQRLNLLIYSVCVERDAGPDYCVSPWQVRMEMYGRHDIALGAFLDKYCFANEYRCPARACAASMHRHERRFVHADSVVSVTCAPLHDEDAPHDECSTVWWSLCSTCGAASSAVALSHDALSLSLAKYLELRFLAPRFVSPACRHPLFQHHAHYFARGGAAACFRLTRLSTWRVVLPPRALRDPHDTRAERDALLARVATLLERAHAQDEQEVKRLASEAQALVAWGARTSHAARVRALWRAGDALTAAERAVRGTIDDTSAGDDGRADDGAPEEGSVRALLAQLLSGARGGAAGTLLVTAGGLRLEVALGGGGVGGVVAAALAHPAHAAAVAAQTTDASPHVEVPVKEGLICRVYYAALFRRLRALLVAPLSADGSTGGAASEEEGGETQEGEDEGALGDVEEGYIRSLADCVPWSARGGKSGSTFSKTKDERFVLKEMSRMEWAQFCEWAPAYVEYAECSAARALPSLLARIVGAYGVAAGGGAGGGGVLVMENVFHEAGAALTQRFDLKGGGRRGATGGGGGADAVLLDADLSRHARTTPLYVSAEAGEVLFAGVERDTEFLAEHHVMDYSLLLGVDESGRRLVLGLIDYIRTFTWDKRLEHLVKKNLGSGQPTVVSPELYRARFLAALRRYFLPTPSRWDNLHNGLNHQPQPTHT